jgi:hypothetical protein
VTGDTVLALARRQRDEIHRREFLEVGDVFARQTGLRRLRQRGVGGATIGVRAIRIECDGALKGLDRAPPIAALAIAVAELEERRGVLWLALDRTVILCDRRGPGAGVAQRARFGCEIVAAGRCARAHGGGNSFADRAVPAICRANL